MNDNSEDVMHNRNTRVSTGIVRGVVLLFFVCLLCGRMTGQIYVSPSGNDTNDGSIGSPYATIGKAMSVVTAGGTIYLRDGIYYNAGTLRPNRSGSAGSFINLWAYPGEHPIVDFSPETYSSSSRGFYLSQDYWYLKGLVVRYAGDNGIYITGAHNIVEDCVIYGNKDTGLQISGGGSYNITINSDSFLNYDSLTHGGNADGFDAKLDIGPGNEFHGCRAWNNSDDGYDLFEGQYRVLFDSCWSFHNGYNLWGDLAFGGNGNGFKVGGNYIPASHILTRCVAFDNKSKGFDQNHNTAGCALYNCTAYRNQSKNFSFPEVPTTGQDTLINNVQYSGSVSLEASALLSSNSWQLFTVTGADFVTLDTSLATAPRNPDWSIPTNGFLRLAPGSQMIDAGQNVGLPFMGSAPDLGAFETASGSWIYTIISSAGTGGTISPSGYVTAHSGDSALFTVTPSTGYHILNVIVDGNPVGALSGYTFYGVTTGHTISATFQINSYTISVSSGPNGTVVPGGSLSVIYGVDTTILFQPNQGYHVDSVFVDSVYIGKPSSYTFHAVQSNHSLFVAFSINKYSLSIIPPDSGLVGVAPVQALYDSGTTVQLTATPVPGYHFVNWTGDAGGSTNPLNVLMTRNLSIGATFALTLYALPFASGWNLVSLPAHVPDGRKAALFPQAISVAFRYNYSYFIEDTLQPGIGYWLKFGAADTVNVTGPEIIAETLAVVAGWNLIGTVSDTISIQSITSIPPGLVTSKFFGYNGGYKISDTLVPGKGYWVKVGQGGSLVLSGAGGNQQSGRNIRISGFDGEIPPVPPVGSDHVQAPAIPKSVALAQNYPNPFNPSTQIEFQIPTSSHVTLAVYDVLGRKLEVLVDEQMNAGIYNRVWNAQGYESGVYFCRLTAGSHTEMKKMILMK